MIKIVKFFRWRAEWPFDTTYERMLYHLFWEDMTYEFDSKWELLRSFIAAMFIFAALADLLSLKIL